MIYNITNKTRGKQAAPRVWFGLCRCKDLVGTNIRELMEENVAKFDPFNRNRESHHVFLDKPSRGLYYRLTEDILDRFIENKRREFRRKYV